MATPTFLPLATVTLVTPASSFDFFNITQEYRDIFISIVGNVTTRTGQNLALNGSTSNFTSVWAKGNGSSATSGTTSNAQFGDVWENSTTNLTSGQLHIMDYSATDKHKTVLTRTSNATPNGVEMRAMRWADTSAVNEISLIASGTTWIAGTTATLYGIAG